MQRIYIHPLPVRIWHWINAFGFVLMVLTGIQIRYVGLVDVVSFRTAVLLHNAVGFVIIANFFVWLLFYIFSDRIMVYLPEVNLMKQYRGSVRQLMYYGYGIFKGDPNPHHLSIYRKFNPLQSLTYQIVMLLLVPVQAFTGVLLWDLTRFQHIVNVLGGVRVVDTVHVLIFIFFAAYILVHPYLGTLGHTRLAHFKAMVTGYEELEEEPAETAAKLPLRPLGAERAGVRWGTPPQVEVSPTSPVPLRPRGRRGDLQIVDPAGRGMLAFLALR